MPLTNIQISEAADALLTAEKNREQIGLLSLKYPDMTLDDAYAIQAAQLEKKAEHRVIGWKIGLTSKVMQDALGIDTPDSGVLYDYMRFDTGAVIPRDHFIQPRIEAEIAFVMKAPLEGEVTREEVLAATDYVVPSLEILDTRIVRKDDRTGQARVIFDTVSDNAANAGIVLGKEQHSPEAFDLRWVGSIVKKDGDVVATGLGAGVQDDPVTGLVWLARRMATYGQRIEPGQVVLSGSFIGPVECPSGSDIEADFGSFGMVKLRFE
ncbi:2-oxo-hepta-3-ene-1,7-dioic acid hydratase [Vreelandella neptunia]|uniref:2-oxo-hepta-3-ene-1,7-dioic acid hydratase n=1 Tax=Vreelandella neptunia TaxID=115551 RepID=A0ABS9SC95_9GAMM|nr:2-oxo-hepta-3-ene-1,7-dioic acid hydratase [Halomonas neptunia]MCH4813717.1 2-oxo-hepta-3-ene-1,7-dioic acid hydratase [Halomonas neptunia]